MKSISFSIEKVASFASKNFLTDHEHLEMKRLKHEKLLGKRRLMELLDDFRQRRNGGPVRH